MMNYTDSRDAIFNELYNIALKDKDVIVISCDTGCFMSKNFKETIPAQYYNFGIAEQNAMSVAAGLAIEGKKVFVYGITNFVSIRCLEQIRVDICGMNLPVTIIASGTGYTYSSDGLTHHITDDISAIRALPNMTIYNASSYNSCAKFIHYAYENCGPTYLRFDKGPFKYQDSCINLNGNNNMRQVSTQSLDFYNDKIIISTGAMIDIAIQVGLETDIRVFDFYKLKNINLDTLLNILGVSTIYTIEEHTIVGGLFSIISEIVAQHLPGTKVYPFGIKDKFIYEVGDRDYMRKLNGLDIDSIIKGIIK